MAGHSAGPVLTAPITRRFNDRCGRRLCAGVRKREDMMKWNSAAFWEREWINEKKRSLYEMRQNKMDQVEWWNRRAPGFNARHGENKSGGSRETILEMIHRSGFVDPGAWMLDIGCGPGNYAIPLAARFEKVVALDVSQKMLSILEERAGARGIRNIETVCMSWEDVDLDKMGWRSRFGLVAAIKSPGIRDVETLRRMIDASMSGCFYSGFVMREDGAQADIWQMMFREEMPPVSADAFYIFHLVHALGYLPAIELHRYMNKSGSDIEAAKENLALMMAPYEDHAGMMAERISGYVEKKSMDGTFERTVRSEEGSVLWSVNPEATALGK